MVRTVLIEDEAHIRDDLKEKLASLFGEQLSIVAEIDTVLGGIEAIENQQPDLLLLDIHLTDGTIFDILDRVQYQNYEIIFITAYDKHAIKAIKVGALDFIFKTGRSR